MVGPFCLVVVGVVAADVVVGAAVVSGAAAAAAGAGATGDGADGWEALDDCGQPLKFGSRSQISFLAGTENK